MNGYKIVLLISMMFWIGGCWDVEEIDRRDLVLAMGLDAAPERMIRLTMQMPLAEYTLPPAAGGKTKEKKFYTLSFVSHTILGAVAREQTNTPRTLVPGQIKSILFEEPLVRQGIEKYLDYLVRIPKIPRSAAIFICREPAERILEQVPVQEYLPGMGFPLQLESSLKQDLSYRMPLWRFMQRLDETGVDPYAPLLSYQERSQTFQILGLGVFRHSRLVGFLNPEQTKIFGIITGKLNGGYLEIPLGKDQYAAFRSVTAKSRIIPGKGKQAPGFKINLSVQGSLSELMGTPICVSAATYRRIERRAESYIKDLAQETIVRLQAWESDILDFGLEYRAHHPESFNPKTWRRQFREARTEVTVKFKISRTGLFH